MLLCAAETAEMELVSVETLLVKLAVTPKIDDSFLESWSWIFDVAPPTYDNSVDVTLDCEIFPFVSDTNARLPIKLETKTVLAAPGNAAWALAFVKYWLVPSVTLVVVRGWNDLSPRQYWDVVPATIIDSFALSCDWIFDVAPPKYDNCVVVTVEFDTLPVPFETRTTFDVNVPKSVVAVEITSSCA